MSYLCTTSFSPPFQMFHLQRIQAELQWAAFFKWHLWSFFFMEFDVISWLLFTVDITSFYSMLYIWIWLIICLLPPQRCNNSELFHLHIIVVNKKSTHYSRVFKMDKSTVMTITQNLSWSRFQVKNKVSILLSISIWSSDKWMQERRNTWAGASFLGKQSVMRAELLALCLLTTIKFIEGWML